MFVQMLFLTDFLRTFLMHDIFFKEERKRGGGGAKERGRGRGGVGGVGFYK